MRHEAWEEGAGRRFGPAAGRLLVEMGMIVFSILLALWVNEWRDHRANRELADAAVRNIRLEVVRNREAVARALPGHRALLEEVRRAEGELEHGAETVRLNAVLEPPTVLHTAWDTASTTGALAHMDYGQVLELADLYSGQDWLKRLEDRLLGSITSNEADRLRRVRGLESSLRNYVDMEESLEKAYDQELSRLSGGPAGRASPPGPQG